MSIRTLSQRKLSTEVYNKTKAVPYTGPKGSVDFGASGYLTVPANAAWVFSGDHTLEAWVYSSSTGDQHIFGGGGAGSNDQFGFSTGTGDARIYYCYSAINSYLTSTATIPSNTWTHVAVSRSGTTLRAFVNGVQVGSATVSGSIGQNATNYIGRRQGSTNQLSGKMSSLRVNTTALYTANFIVSGTLLSAVSGTVLLTCQNPTTVVDNSTNAFTVTVNSPAAASSTSPF